MDEIVLERVRGIEPLEAVALPLSYTRAEGEVRGTACGTRLRRGLSISAGRFKRLPAVVLTMLHDTGGRAFNRAWSLALAGPVG